MVWLSLIFFSSASIAVGWCGRAFQRIVTVLLAGLPRDQQVYSNLFFAAEKSVHLMLFALLGVLLWRNLPDVPWRFNATLLAGLTVGVASELLQRFFPGRDPTIRDVIINVAGTAIGAAISLSLARRVAGQSKASAPQPVASGD